MSSLGENIKKARIKKGLTQRQLADLIGAKHNSISNWEKGQNKPDPDTIELIGGVLDVSIEFLLVGFDKTLFVQLVNYIRNGRTHEQFSKDTGVELNELVKICTGSILEAPKLEIIENIVKNNPVESIVDNEAILASAGYIANNEYGHLKQKEIGKLIENTNPIKDMNQQTTLAAHRTDGYDEELPEEAKEELKNFIEYLKVKYKKKVD